MTDRADEIIDAAERVLRDRRGRSAPVQNQAPVSDWGPLYRYIQGVVLGAVAGLIIGYGLGVAFPQDTCKVRASASHLSVCLDGQIAKAKGLMR
ncbi:hypothetical protein [Bradyrhizobium sp. DASA03007]|uniref:hypothetical protein n=1 Tax=unclassified Bradyrhizobium TaxID=2631580 RepID=UPI003F702FEE